MNCAAMEIIYILLEKMGVQRKDLRLFAVFMIGVMLVSWFLINSPLFASISSVVLIGLFAILFTVLWFVAGYAVFRSLLGASVGLSLIIFIGQSYCMLPEEHRTANDSLMALIGFGFIYVTAQFVLSLYRELFGDKRANEEWRQKGMVRIFKEINDNEHSWFVLITYGLLICLFVWQIYSVVKPIIDGLCVYNK